MLPLAWSVLPLAWSVLPLAWSVLPIVDMREGMFECMDAAAAVDGDPIAPGARRRTARENPVRDVAPPRRRGARGAGRR